MWFQAALALALAAKLATLKNQGRVFVKRIQKTAILKLLPDLDLRCVFKEITPSPSTPAPLRLSLTHIVLFPDSSSFDRSSFNVNMPQFNAACPSMKVPYYAKSTPPPAVFAVSGVSLRPRQHTRRRETRSISCPRSVACLRPSLRERLNDRGEAQFTPAVNT